MLQIDCLNLKKIKDNNPVFAENTYYEIFSPNVQIDTNITMESVCNLT